jgi:hypothetical protein
MDEVLDVLLPFFSIFLSVALTFDYDICIFIVYYLLLNIYVEAIQEILLMCAKAKGFHMLCNTHIT